MFKLKITMDSLFILLILFTLIYVVENNQSNKSNRTKNDKGSCLNVLVKTNPLKSDHSECDFFSEGPVCIYNGERVILPNAVQNGLVGYWTFDDIKPLDYSGNQNHALKTVSPGPSFSGFGSSALFTAGNYLEIPFDKQFYSNDFSITFWLFLVQDYYSSKEGNINCPLIQRGNDDLYAKNYHRAPGIYLDRKLKNLKVYIKTSNPDKPLGELLVSNVKVANQRWLHITVTKSYNKVKLYVNGILDSQILLKNDMEINQDNLFIGNVPWLKDQCNFPFLIDELRYYDTFLPENYIQAEAAPALGGIEPSLIMFGCNNCPLKEASTSCVDGYHVCTSIELHTGGYQVARAMGWLDWNTHIWSHGALGNPGEFSSLKGLALCCMDLK